MQPIVAQYDSAFHFYYYDQKQSHFEKLPTVANASIWLGDSITDGGEWDELFPGINAINRGISSDITFGVLHRLPEIIRWKPKRLFVMIGINDIARGIPDHVIVANIEQVIKTIKKRSPKTQLIIQSILPTNNNFKDFIKHQNKLHHINAVNSRLRQLCQQHRAYWLNLHPFFSDTQGNLDKKYTNDGLHLTGAGYLIWKQVILEHKLI
jgi:lysophospholipase L1-like esterase